MAKIRSNEARGKRAAVWMLIITCFMVIMAMNAYYMYSTYDRMNSGSFSMDDLVTFGLVLMGIGFVNIVVYVLTIVFFIMWFRRAYYNLHQLTGGLTYSEGWAAGAWFIPIFHLFGPYQIARELFDKSTNILGEKVSADRAKSYRMDLGMWWAFWVAGNIVGSISNFLERDENNMDTQMTGAIVQIGSSALLIIAGLYCIRVIKNYMTIEKELEVLDSNQVVQATDNTDLLDTSI